MKGEYPAIGGRMYVSGCASLHFSLMPTSSSSSSSMLSLVHNARTSSFMRYSEPEMTWHGTERASALSR